MSSDGECFRVPVGEILAACRALYPTTHSVLNVETTRATPTIPGFTSLMLRVSVTARRIDGSEVNIKMIYKRPAVIPKQLELLGNMELFEREVTYFRDVVPMLKRHCPHLSLVQCYFCENLTLLLEDLTENGFSSVVPDIKSLEVTALYISLGHVKLVVRRLAQMHAASLGHDWLAILPQLEADALYDSEVARFWYRPKTRKSCEILATVMLQYLDPVRCRAHVDWLLQSDNCFNEISRLARFVPGKLNVLCHGDCHVNNLMFKHDEQGNPTEVKFVDLQLFRYAPPSRDLLYFLYTSTGCKFRLQHEQEVLQTYVEAFNAAVCTTPDLMTLDTLMAEYETSRMYGLGAAISMKPLLFSRARRFLPNAGETLSAERVQAMAEETYSTQDIVQILRENTKLRDSMLRLAEETIQVLENAGLV